MKAIELRFGAMLCVMCAVLAWGCSGEKGGSGPDTSIAGVGSCPSNEIGCHDPDAAHGGAGQGGAGSGGTDGGSAGVSASGGTGNGGAGNAAGEGGHGSVGSGGDSGSGSGGTGSGGSGSTGSTGGSSSTGGTAGDPDAGDEDAEAGTAGAVGSDDPPDANPDAIDPPDGGADDAQDGGTPEAGSDTGSGGTSGSDAGGSGSGGHGSVTGDAAAGSGGTSGSSGSSGTGGTSGTGGSAGTGGSPPQALDCTGWTRFPTGFDLSSDTVSFSASDAYVATGNYATGEISHYDGVSWSPMTLPTLADPWSAMATVWGSSPNDVWAGGSTRLGAGVPKGRLLHRVNSGAWQVDASLVLAFGDTIVRSIWSADANNVFALVESFPGTASWDVKVFNNTGSGWVAMALPSHYPRLKMNHIWGKSANEVYAVGSLLDGTNNPIEGILWKYNGSTWSKITTIPSDVVYISDVNGSTDVEVVGYVTGSGSQGVRLTTTDLTTWDRYDSTVTAVDSRVWSPWTGASLVGGTVEPQTSGSARLGERSMGSWQSEQSLDAIAQVVTGITPIPGTNQVWVATYGNSGADSAMYRGTCQ